MQGDRFQVAAEGFRRRGGRRRHAGELVGIEEHAEDEKPGTSQSRGTGESNWKTRGSNAAGCRTDEGATPAVGDNKTVDFAPERPYRMR